MLLQPHLGRPRFRGLATAMLCTLGFGSAAADCPVTPWNYPLGRSNAFYKPAFPDRAKDFAVIAKDGLYHAIYIRIDRNPGAPTGNEVDFGHATSPNFFSWTQLANLNPDGGYAGGVPTHFSWDASHVWAPHIVLTEGTYYMFFTGVDAQGNQRIGVSTSTDLSSWTPYAGNPVYSVLSIPWAWQPTTNQQLRDPFVMRDITSRDGSGVNGWLMYFNTNTNSTTQTIGKAWASFSNLYSWHDLGEITSARSGHSESPHVLLHNGTYYLFDSPALADAGVQYWTSADPVASTWSGPTKLNDTTQGGGFQQNWFASETISSGSADYLLFIHDYDPPVTGDPLCGNPTPSTIETKQMIWNGSTFTLRDDFTPPAQILLSAGAGCYDHIFLSWQAPGDDGATGTATAYDLRWSSSVITEANFTAATVILTNAPLPGGSWEEMTVDVPYCSARRYYAIKARDEANNWSAISNVPFAKPACPNPPVQCYDAKPGVGGPEEPGVEHQELALSIPAGHRTADGPMEVRFTIPTSLAGVDFEIAVFDVSGRRIARLAGGLAAPGDYTEVWDTEGTDRTRIAAGIYLVRLRVGSTDVTRRVVVVR